MNGGLTAGWKFRALAAMRSAMWRLYDGLAPHPLDSYLRQLLLFLSGGAGCVRTCAVAAAAAAAMLPLLTGDVIAR